MLPKTLLAIARDDDGVSGVRTAIALAEQLDAHLRVLVVSIAPPPPMTMYAGVPADIWATHREDEMRQLRAAAENVRNEIRRASISGDVVAEFCMVGQASNQIGQHARHADLTLIGPDMATASWRDEALDGALFASGRPVYVHPDEGAPTLRPRRIAIAWNGALEAARAVREALPFMVEAGAADIVLVDPPMDDALGRGEPGAQIAAYLARHGIAVTLHQVPSGGRRTSETIAAHVRELGSDMLVMGAYGHSRLREWIFGGTTRALLARPPLPILAAR